MDNERTMAKKAAASLSGRLSRAWPMSSAKPLPLPVVGLSRAAPDQRHIAQLGPAACPSMRAPSHIFTNIMDKRARIPPGLPRDSPTQSYWQDPADDIADLRTTPDLPREADIVIIGSRVSGASVSYNLLSADSSLKIVLIEGRQAASGASGRNGRS